MDNVKKLKETVDLFVKDAKSISKLSSFDEVYEMERKCVSELQAAQVLTNNCGRDLYDAVQARKAELEKQAVEV